jgi:hypothetical protein
MMVIFADGIVDCIGPFIGIIFFLLISAGSWILQQVAEANKRAAQQRRVAPRQTPQQATSEMQEFLRRASEQTSPQVRPTPPATEAEIYTAEVIEPRVLRPSVTSHVSTDDLARHARELGEELDQADERLDERMHRQFDHAVGALGDSSDAVHEDPRRGALPKEAVTTREIIDVFRHPERIREAIIMAEILDRRV